MRSLRSRVLDLPVCEVFWTLLNSMMIERGLEIFA